MRIALTTIMTGLLAVGCQTHEQAYTIIYRPSERPAAARAGNASAADGPASTNAHFYTEAQSASLTPVSSNSASRIYAESPEGTQASPAPGALLNDDNPWNPQDKGLADADRAIVRQIRQSMRQDNLLSIDEPGLRITVKNGQVLFDGAVKNETERKRLDALSRKTAGVVSVQDQLAVKPD